jgi:DNA-binding transcriptional regulator YiaG
VTAGEFKEIRLDLGWTQAALAEVLGLSPRCIRMYEAGHRKVSQPTAKLLRLISANREQFDGREHEPSIRLPKNGGGVPSE